MYMYRSHVHSVALFWLLSFSGMVLILMMERGGQVHCLLVLKYLTSGTQISNLISSYAGACRLLPRNCWAVGQVLQYTGVHSSILAFLEQKVQILTQAFPPAKPLGRWAGTPVYSSLLAPPVLNEYKSTNTDASWPVYLLY